MKTILHERALAITAQTLAITSNLLAIGIEVGVIAGGYYIFKKMTAKEEAPEKTEMIVERAPYPPKKTFKDKFNKIKNIIGAVIG